MEPSILLSSAAVCSGGFGPWIRALRWRSVWAITASRMAPHFTGEGGTYLTNAMWSRRDPSNQNARLPHESIKLRSATMVDVTCHYAHRLDTSAVAGKRWSWQCCHLTYMGRRFSYPCGTGGRASLAFEPRSLHSQSCAHQRPYGAQLWGQLVPGRCMPGRCWRNPVYPASVRTRPYRRRRFLLGKAFKLHDTSSYRATEAFHRPATTGLDSSLDNEMARDGLQAIDSTGGFEWNGCETRTTRGNQAAMFHPTNCRSGMTLGLPHPGSEQTAKSVRESGD